MAIDIVLFLEIMGTDNSFDKVISSDIDKVLNGASFGILTTFRDFIHSEPEAFTFFGKEKHILVVGTDKEVFYKVFITGSRGFLSYTTTSLGLVFIDRSTLDIACIGDGNDYLFVRNNILYRDITASIFNYRATFVPIFGFYF